MDEMIRYPSIAMYHDRNCGKREGGMGTSWCAGGKDAEHRIGGHCFQLNCERTIRWISHFLSITWLWEITLTRTKHAAHYCTRPWSIANILATSNCWLGKPLERHLLRATAYIVCISRILHAVSYSFLTPCLVWSSSPLTPSYLLRIFHVTCMRVYYQVY